MIYQIPEPDRYTIKLLAKRWDTYESHIEQLIEDGKLRAEVDEGNGQAGHDPESMLEWERCKRLIPHPSRSFMPGGLSWKLGSRIMIRREEVERIEQKCVQQPEPAPQALINDMPAFINQNRGRMSEDEMIYRLRENGYQNNEIGVALGGTYREGSNALAIKISKKYNSFKRKLGT